MGQLSDWPESNEDAHSVGEEFLILCETIEHLTCALGVANVGNFLLSSNFKGVVNFSSNV